eukprot:Clim_evm11s240 gene=Clim_evmTU11s240
MPYSTKLPFQVPPESCKPQSSPVPYMGKNPYKNDLALQSLVHRYFSPELAKEVEADLIRFGDRAPELGRYHHLAEAQEPVLYQYDGFGNRIDNIEVCDGWKKLHDMTCEERIISIPWDSKYKEQGRIFWMAKSIIYNPLSGLYSCPAAMTDAAVSVCKSLQDPYLNKEVLPRLLTNTPDEWFTSGQWMTERLGGSDVSAYTETVAVPLHGQEVPEDQLPGGSPDANVFTHRLYGIKWFTSAASRSDTEISFTLAREVDPKTGKAIPGNKGLTLFFVSTRMAEEARKKYKEESGADRILHPGIKILRMKNKMGTKSLPTAEMQLDGLPARKLSERGQGIQAISDMLNVTRVHNSIGGVAGQRHHLQLVLDYAQRRTAFGSRLIDNPMHMHVLDVIQADSTADMHFCFNLGRMMGLHQEKKINSRDALALRTLTAVLKLSAAKNAVRNHQELLECFGGNGYIEDTGIPTIIRNAHVLPLWEGTTNILALDLLRVEQKSGGKALKNVAAICRDVLNIGALTGLGNEQGDIVSAINVVTACANAFQKAMAGEYGTDQKEVNDKICVIMRSLALLVGRVYSACMLYEHVLMTQEDHDAELLKTYVNHAPLAAGGLAGVTNEVALRLRDLTESGRRSASEYGSVSRTFNGIRSSGGRPPSSTQGARL